jgi:hypothetical protein
LQVTDLNGNLGVVEDGAFIVTLGRGVHVNQITNGLIFYGFSE